MKKTSYKTASDIRGLNVKKNYSSFWMGDKSTRFDGLSGGQSESTNIVKLIKLSNYRRAITNFVKIVTNQDIPVLWAGDTSYTNGKMICLSTDIKDNNFDVTVGLALHEASHIILSDFELLQQITTGKCDDIETFIYRHKGTIGEYELRSFVKDMLNWIEDRRIDNFIFSTSPGYKAYYHKLYDYFWHNDSITKGLQSSVYRDARDLNSWFFHIINMINPAFDSTALPGLDQITNIVDLKNIKRLSNTSEALSIAIQVMEVIIKNKINAVNPNPKQEPANSSNPSGNDQEQDLQGTSGSGEDGAPQDLPTQSSSKINNTEQETPDTNDTEAPQDLPTLSPSEMTKITQAIQQQRNFLQGSTNKKVATRTLKKELDSVASDDITIQTTTDGKRSQSCLLYDFTKSTKLIEAYDLFSLRNQLYTKGSNTTEIDQLSRKIKALSLPDIFYVGRDNSQVHDNLKRGFELGGLLGKKLQLHNESRERVDTRLQSGKIDNKRLAHAGYGVEGIFKQIRIDKFKKANIHISLDASGSMSGAKWESTVQMTAAIVKAASYTQGISVQVSVRTSKNDTPVAYLLYDSQRNSLGHFTKTLTIVHPTNYTPEGMTFEGMYKDNWFKPSTKDLDSYFLNISDGAPGCGNYYGSFAERHTAGIISKLKSKLNIQVLSFFIENTNTVNRSSTAEDFTAAYVALTEKFNSSGVGKSFKVMYGKDASVVDPHNAIMIARELNKKFLTPAN